MCIRVHTVLNTCGSFSDNLSFLVNDSLLMDTCIQYEVVFRILRSDDVEKLYWNGKNQQMNGKILTKAALSNPPVYFHPFSHAEFSSSDLNELLSNTLINIKLKVLFIIII